ncbi:MAG: hypothetical protein NT157_02535, partial [Candidatus Micrarchaeota archaeon]|nr:hypothetical protein [Candidatus Micrarchaeota archaeon]
DVINGPAELMELATAIGKSDLTEHEKERFFNSLKDECLAEFGHVKKTDFNRILDEIENERTGK